MQPEKTIKNKAALAWLKSRAQPARKWLLWSVGSGLTSGILLIGQAYLLSRIVHDVFIEGRDRSTMTPFFLMLVAIIVVRAGLGWFREVAGFRAGAAVREEIRRALLKHIGNMGPVGLSHLPAGGLVSSALEQIEALHNFVARYLPQMALAALLPMVILAFVFPISWAAGIILLVAAPLIPLFMILVGMGAESISQKHFQALARMSAHFLDVLRGLPTLKQFGRSKDQVEEITQTSRAYRRRTMAVLRMAFLSSAVLEFFTAISIALVAVYLGMYFLGYIQFGAYGTPLDFRAGFFILLLAPDFFLPLRELGTHYHARADAVGASEEIMRIFDQPGLAVSPPEEGIAPAPPMRIAFKKVHVKYRRTGQTGIRNIDVVINKGERIAVVGASGAGKSTLIHLLLGFVSPTAGKIEVDGVDLLRLEMDAWRRHCAWIGQHPMLFTGTLQENIALARPDATDVRIETAARRAGVMEFAERWDQGLKTRIGEQGLGLSAGQAQRVALARALIREAPIVLLDEPTAALDTATEAQILADLDQWTQDRTLLMATHRPAPLALADRVIILKNGKLEAQGNIEDLRQTHGALLDGTGRP